MNTSISFVIPILNEADSIAFLHKEIKDICTKNGYNYEIIIVNDGSTDESAKVVDELSPIKAIHLRKRYGQTAALDAGIKAAKYPFVITLDGDGQNDPSDVPNLVHHLIEHDLDVVSGWRKNRQDPNSKKLVSRVANHLRKILVDDGINDSGCTLKIYRKACFDHVSLYGEMHRFIPGLLKAQGYKVGEIVVNHRHRNTGVSKYNWTRTVKGLLDMLALWFWGKYAVRPLHLLGGIGFAIILTSFFSGGMSVLQLIKGQDMSETFWPIFTLFLFILGMMFIVFGLTLDLLVRLYYETKDNKPYQIRNVTERNT